MEMAKVQQCDASECSYNQNNGCHAFAITIGDESNPMCDTFCSTTEKASGTQMAGVGACKVTACTHNDHLECNCSQIKVGHNGGQINCMSFEQR